MEGMNVFFPQWQAGAQRERIQLGANRLRDWLELRAKFQTVATLDNLDLTITDDVKGKSDLLEHLRSFRSILEVAQPENLFVLGGDCGVSLLPITYLNARVESSAEKSGEKMAVIWLDAHADINTPASSSSKHFHGMVLRSALGEGNADMLELAFKPIRPDQVILVGARDFDAPESEFVTAQKIKRFSSENTFGVLEYLRNAGFSSLYVHLDFDVFDPSGIDFMRFPTPGGLSIQTVVNLLEQLRSEFKVIGCALTECGPRDEAHWQSDHHKLEPILAALPIT
jgi:arginase